MNQSDFSLLDHHYYPLKSWELLSVKGQDASSFLQGQISCDIEAVRGQEAQLGACINLKGRVISNFIVSKVADNDFLLLCPLKSLTLTQSILKKYAVFSKVSIEEIQDQRALAVSQPLDNSFSISSLNCHFLCIDGKNPVDLESNFKEASEDAFLAFTIASGLCLVDETLSEKFTAQEINLDLVNGISFNKGCYTGQEVVARLHYRGVPKRRAFCALLNDKAKASESLLDQVGKAQGDVLNTVNIGNSFPALLSLSIKAMGAFPQEALLCQDSQAEVLNLSSPPYNLEIEP